MAQHVFVAMPFGTKEGVNFNKVYSDYIKPALEGAGFEVFRADEELRAGNILTDMFQELLLADLVVVDLSIDNPNVWYELGVRHALRQRGVVQIQSLRDYMPFDNYVERTLRYHIKDGVPDPDFLESDKKALAEFATQTMSAWHGRKTSPVYHLLPNLQQPEWKSLRVGDVNEFWEAQEKWEERIEVARMQGRPGDIMVFAEDLPTRFLRLEAYRAAGEALFKLEQFEFALKLFEKALEIDETDLDSRRRKGGILGRLERYPQADVWLKEVVKNRPDDAESLGLLGRVEKDTWIKAWKRDGQTPEQMREAARAQASFLKEAIRAYLLGFRKDPSYFYPGINALTLMCLLKHLTGRNEKPQERKALEGGVRWAVESALAKDPRDYWARVTLADLELLSGKEREIKEAYENAVAVAEKDRYALNSTRQQLLLLQDLSFRPLEVAAALSVLNREMETLEIPKEPERIFLFSGHMIDRPDREEPRFPANKEEIAAAAIAGKLEELGAGPADLALCSAANGGDILFAEACLARKVPLEVRLPFNVPAFLEKSVTFAGVDWQERFYRIKEGADSFQLMPDELGPTPKDSDPYRRVNLWMLYSALAHGPRRVHFICLWDGREGDGPGGTKHMYDTVVQFSGKSHILETKKLW